MSLSNIDPDYHRYVAQVVLFNGSMVGSRNRHYYAPEYNTSTLEREIEFTRALVGNLNIVTFEYGMDTLQEWCDDLR